MGLLAAGSVVLGVAPQLAVNYLLNPILAALGLGAGVHVTWLGLSADAGSFSTTGGLVLALVSVVLGGAIYLVAYAFRPASASTTAAMAGAGGGVFTGGEPLSEQGRLTAGDFSEIFQEHWQSFFRWTNVDRAYLAVWSGLQAVSRALGVAVAWMERRAALLAVVLAAAVLALLRWTVPGGAALGPRTLELPAFDQMPLLLIAAAGIALIALLLAALPTAAGRNMALPMLLIGGLTVDGLLTINSSWRLGILEAAALLTVLLVWQTARSNAAKLTYLAVVLISAGSAVAGDVLADHGQFEWARALLLTGIFVKLAAVPMLFWLLSLADELPALTLGIIIAVVDMAAFGEFLLATQAMPSLLAPRPLLLYAAALTSLLAALLMLAQRSLKRLLVLSTVEDVGFLLLGIASVSIVGIQGAIIAASTHALAKALLFTCLAAPEADGALDGEPFALAARYPVSAFGFLFGMLAMLGVPPTMGFIGRWRLYSAALTLGPGWLAVFVVSSVLALIAYTLALTRNWWGPPGNSTPSAGAGGDAHATAGQETGDTAREPFAIKAVIVALVAVLLAAGIWPAALHTLTGVRP